MARRHSIGIRDVLTSFLPRGLLMRLAAEASVGRRRRKVRVHALFWTLVLGFGAGRERTLAGLRRAYERATRTTLVASAFYDRFTPQLARFLRAVAVHLLQTGASWTKVRDYVWLDGRLLAQVEYQGSAAYTYYATLRS